MASLVNVLSYSSTNVSTSAYTQLIASTVANCGRLEITDTSGKILKIAKGASGSEQDICTVAISGTVVIPYYLPLGTRLSIIAVDSTATTGYNCVSLIP